MDSFKADEDSDGGEDGRTVIEESSFISPFGPLILLYTSVCLETVEVPS